jgi:hypothetical protein
MIGIYQDNFIDYLRDSLGEEPQITGKNIIIPCPWCEYGKLKDHYHLYISLYEPIYNCFHSECTQSGFLTKLIKKIEGVETHKLRKFVDLDKLKSNPIKKKSIVEGKDKLLQIPKININEFPKKTLYIKKRFKFSSFINIENIPNLIFDFDKFLRINNITLTEPKQINMVDYLQSNFVGFLTINNAFIIFRNIDEMSDFKHFKFTIDDKTKFLDYYKILGRNPLSKKVILAEGIYDIFSEYLFDFTGNKNDVYLYACSMSTNFRNLIKSIVFNEQDFKLDIIILSDKGIKLEYYQKLKKYNSFIINSLKVYYNRANKDFNEVPVILTEFKI